MIQCPLEKYKIRCSLTLFCRTRGEREGWYFPRVHHIVETVTTHCFVRPWCHGPRGRVRLKNSLGLGLRIFFGGGGDYSAEKDALLLISRMFRVMLTKIHSQIQKFMLVETELPGSCIGQSLFYAAKILASSTINIQNIFNFNMSSSSFFISLKKLLGARRRLSVWYWVYTPKEIFVPGSLIIHWELSLFSDQFHNCRCRSHR